MTPKRDVACSQALSSARYDELCDRVIAAATRCSSEQVLDLCDTMHSLIRERRSFANHHDDDLVVAPRCDGQLDRPHPQAAALTAPRLQLAKSDEDRAEGDRPCLP